MARVPQNVMKVVPKSCGSLALKDEISSRGSQRLAGICISEMSQIFLCFKNHAFNEEACSREILNFQKCYNRHVELYNNPDNKLTKKKADINRLLQKYPPKMEQRER